MKMQKQGLGVLQRAEPTPPGREAEEAGAVCPFGHVES